MPKRGGGADCERCMVACLERLPPLGEASSVGRVMIEVKARCVLARVWWVEQRAKALEQVQAVLCALHAQGVAPPLQLTDERGREDGDILDWSWEEIEGACSAWRKGCRADPALQEVAKEFGCRLSVSRGTRAAAALLVAGQCYREAAMVFCDLHLWGHAMRCALLSGKHPYCLEIAIAHPNPVFVRNECLPVFSPALASVARAFLEWDSHALDVIRVSPETSVAVRTLASMALDRLNATEE